jgi:NTP pyrophosphatase (non-canonical NTP hydrolase)
MDPAAYARALQKFFYKDGRHISLAGSALGLCGEAAEVVQLFEEAQPGQDVGQFHTNLKLELGDVLWYVAAMFDSLGKTMLDIDSMFPAPDLQKLVSYAGELEITDLLLHMGRHAGHAADRIKKYEWHGKTLDQNGLFADLTNIVTIVSELAARTGMTVEELFQANVDKLEARYPGGFTEGGGNR